MRIPIVVLVAGIFSAAVGTMGFAQELSDTQLDDYVARGSMKLLPQPFSPWNVFFGKLYGSAGEWKYMYFKPGFMLAYPNPEDGVILKCRPEGDTQYCVFIAVRKAK
jgi:hypothetical protein